MTSVLSRGDSARTAIFDAALGILQSQGAGALTVRSVASAAGCSTTGVYTWFGGKSGLVEAIFVDGFRRLSATIAAGPRTTDPVYDVVAGCRAYRAWGLANPTHYTVMFGHAVPDFEPSESARYEGRAAFEWLVRGVERAVAAGAMNGDPFELATFLWAGIHGYVSVEIAHMSLHGTPAEHDRAFEDGVRRLMVGCTVD